MQLWALVSSEKLIKSDTAAGDEGGQGGCEAEGEKEHERGRVTRQKEPVGVGLLEDQDY